MEQCIEAVVRGSDDISPVRLDTAAHDHTSAAADTAASQLDAEDMDETECDSVSVAAAVLRWLTDNHIHHTVFARSVLGWNRAFSPLLRQPTPWRQADGRTRSAYTVMNQWLRLSHEQRLESVKLRQLQANRKRRVAGELDCGDSGVKQWRAGGDDSDTSSSCASSSSSSTTFKHSSSAVEDDMLSEPAESQRCSRPRVQLTWLQRRALIDIFHVTARPSPAIRRQIAQVLALSVKTVANFFSAARTRGLAGGQRTGRDRQGLFANDSQCRTQMTAATLSQ